MKLTRWLVLGALLLVTGAGQAEKKKSYSTGHFALSLDGTPAMVKSIDGGSEKKTADAAPITLEVDRNGSDALWQWMAETLSQGQVKKSVSLHAKGKRRLDMLGSHITEIKMPALDAKDGKKHIDVSIVIQPGTVTESKDKKDIQGVANAKQKQFQPSNFRLEIGDLPTGRVKKIDAIAFKSIHPAKVTVPDIKFLIDPGDAPSWSAAIKSKAKKTGAIELTESDGTVWKTLKLTGVRVKSVKSATGVSEVTLSVEKVSLH